MELEILGVGCCVCVNHDSQITYDVHSCEPKPPVALRAFSPKHGTDFASAVLFIRRMNILARWLMQNRGYMRQVLVCCSVSTLPFIHGIMQAWPSLSIQRLLDGDAGFSVTKDDISIIVSVLAFSQFLMPILFGFILVKMGRRSNFLLSAVMCIISWALFTFASAPLFLVAANLVGGLANACSSIIGPVYIAEIADKRIRGAMIIQFITAITLGEVFLTNVGIFVSYSQLNATTLVLAVIAFFCIYIFSVESPCWHLMCNDEKKAVISFQYFWNRDMDTDGSQTSTATAFTELKNTVDAEMKSACSYAELFRTPSNIKASVIVNTLSLFQPVSGFSVIMAYATTTLPKYDGFWQPNPTMALLTMINLVIHFIAMGLIEKWGRKPLSIISNAGNALGTFAVAIYFFFDEYTSFDTTNIKWLPYIGVIVFISFFGVGMSTIPHLLVGELFPANVRFYASVVSICCIAGGFSFLNFIYLHVCNLVGVSVVFFIFSLFSATAVVFSYYCVFETKKLSLAEIQSKLIGGN